MKPLFIIPLVLMSLVSFPSWSSSYHGLVERDGLYFEKFKDVPYSGKYVGPFELETGSFVDGRLHGLWTSFHLNGQLSQKGEYQNGKRSGHWVFRFENGKLFMEGSFKDGIKEGFWEIFIEEGRLFKKGQFKNGKKEGYWIFNKRNGEPYARWTGFYKSGAKVGN